MDAGEEDADCLELAFSKKKADARKTWLSSYAAGTYLDQSVQEISYSDFVNKVRPMIPHMSTNLLHLSAECSWL